MSAHHLRLPSLFVVLISFGALCCDAAVNLQYFELCFNSKQENIFVGRSSQRLKRSMDGEDYAFTHFAQPALQDCRRASKWHKAKQNPAKGLYYRTFKDSHNLTYILNLYRGKPRAICDGASVIRKKRQIKPGDDLLDRIGNANVEVDSLDSNITITELLNISSGHSIVDIQEQRLQARILCKSFNMHMRPELNSYNMTFTEHHTQVNVTSSSRFDLSAAFSELVVHAISDGNSGEHINASLESEQSNMTLVHGSALVTVSDAEQSLVLIDTLNTTSQEKVAIMSAVVDDSSMRRDLTIYLLTRNASVVAKLDQAYVFVIYQHIAVEISRDHRSIRINTDTYNITVSTVESPYTITLTDDLNIEAGETIVTVDRLTSDVNVKSNKSYMTIVPDPDASMSMSTNAGQAASMLDLKNTKVDIQANKLDMNINSANERITANTEISATLIHTDFNDVGIKSNRSSIVIQSGNPWIKLLSHNVSVEIRRGDYNGTDSLTTLMPGSTSKSTSQSPAGDTTSTSHNVITSSPSSSHTTSLHPATNPTVSLALTTTKPDNGIRPSNSTQPTTVLTISPSGTMSSNTATVNGTASTESAGTTNAGRTPGSPTTSSKIPTVMVTSSISGITPVTNGSETTDDFIIGQFGNASSVLARLRDIHGQNQAIRVVNEPLEASYDLFSLIPSTSLSNVLELIWKPAKPIADQGTTNIDYEHAAKSYEHLQNLKMTLNGDPKTESNSGSLQPKPTTRPRRTLNILLNQGDHNITIAVPLIYVLSIVLSIPMDTDIQSEEFQQRTLGGLLEAYLLARKRQLGLNGHKSKSQRRKRSFVDENIDLKVSFIGKHEPDLVTIHYYLVTNGVMVKARRAAATYNVLTLEELSQIISYPVTEVPAPVIDQETEDKNTNRPDALAICSLIGFFSFLLFIVGIVAFKNREKTLQLGKDWFESPMKIPLAGLYRRRAENSNKARNATATVPKTIPNSIKGPGPIDPVLSVPTVKIHPVDVNKILDFIKDDIQDLGTPGHEFEQQLSEDQRKIGQKRVGSHLKLPVIFDTVCTV